MNEHHHQPRGLLIIGCGYTGCALARNASTAGVPVWGTTRTSERSEAIRSAGAEPLIFEAGKDTFPDDLREHVDTVIDMVGPPWGDGEDCTDAILEALRPFSIERFVYISSTSVYGDHGGNWVDEDSLCEPSGPAGLRRLAVEALLASHPDRLPTIITRLPGIYGPGRSVIERLRTGRFRVVGQDGPYSNRIHVTDLAKALWACCLKGRVGETYLLSDDAPERLGVVGRYASDLAGLPFPDPLSLEEARATIPPSSLSMLTDSKRLNNARMKEELGIALQFPSYREGLKALHSEEDS